MREMYKLKKNVGPHQMNKNNNNEANNDKLYDDEAEDNSKTQKK
jgi:hypothetical protein